MVLAHEGCRRADQTASMQDELEFEDPFEDEFASEDEDDTDMAAGRSDAAAAASASSASSGPRRAADEAAGGDDEEDEGEDDDGDDAEDDDEDEDDKKREARVWRPGRDTLAEGEQLEYSPEAYVFYHQFGFPWPCLSFDVVPDKLGAGRTKFPLSCYIVAGSQAARADQNALYVAKLADIHRTQHDGDSDNDDDDDSDNSDVDDDPTMDFQSIPHTGGVNRVRVMPQEPHVVATWADTGRVHLWDVRSRIAALDTDDAKSGGALGPAAFAAARRAPVTSGPALTFAGHSCEGFAMDWSPAYPGRLATGDCSGRIQVLDPVAEAAAATMVTPAAAAAAAATSSSAAAAASATAGTGVDGATWRARAAALASHKGSVEDVQWSPDEAEVLASASVDGHVMIWDTRDGSKPVITLAAHTTDVNVLSWNARVPFLLLTGADDGQFCVWDLREVSKGARDPLARSDWHRRAITSIEWDPLDENCLVVCSEDNTVTLWDMSLEPPDEPAPEDVADVPAQMLFMHQGQMDIKEAHFHKQLPGAIMTTAATGFNIFRPDVKLA